MSTFNPTVYPELTAFLPSQGQGAYTNWLRNLAIFLLAFNTPGQEFDTGIPDPPIPPLQQALRKLDPPAASHKPKTSKPTTASPPAEDSDDPTSEPAEADQDEDDSPQQYLYAHIKNSSNLTAAGWIAFDSDTKDYNRLLEKYIQDQRNLIAFIFANLSVDARTILRNNDQYRILLNKPNAAALRRLCDKSFSHHNILGSLASFSSLRDIKLTTTPASLFDATQVAIDALISSYCTPDMPDYISIKSIHVSTLLAALPPSFKPLVDTIILGDVPITSLTVPDTRKRILDWTANQVLYSHNKTTHTKTNTNTNTNTPKPSPAATGSLALLTTDDKPKSQWTPAKPHARPKGTGGPGDPTKPHCSHCALNGWIFNNHGFPGAQYGINCNDLTRLKTPPTKPTPTPAPAPAAASNPWSQQQNIAALLSALATEEATAHPGLDHDTIASLGVSALPHST